MLQNPEIAGSYCIFWTLWHYVIQDNTTSEPLQNRVPRVQVSWLPIRNIFIQNDTEQVVFAICSVFCCEFLWLNSLTRIFLYVSGICQSHTLLQWCFYHSRAWWFCLRKFSVSQVSVLQCKYICLPRQWTYQHCFPLFWFHLSDFAVRVSLLLIHAVPQYSCRTEVCTGHREFCRVRYPHKAFWILHSTRFYGYSACQARLSSDWAFFGFPTNFFYWCTQQISSFHWPHSKLPDWFLPWQFHLIQFHGFCATIHNRRPCVCDRNYT